MLGVTTQPLHTTPSPIREIKTVVADAVWLTRTTVLTAAARAQLHFETDGQHVISLISQLWRWQAASTRKVKFSGWTQTRTPRKFGCRAARNSSQDTARQAIVELRRFCNLR